MAITQTIEWTIEGAWLTVLRASTDLVGLLAAATSIRRAYDLTAGIADVLPAVLVECVSAIPQMSRGDGYYDAEVHITAVTQMDDDLTGSVRANLCGAIRDVFEATGLPGDLQTASAGTMLVFAGGVQSPTSYPAWDNPAGGKPTRERTMAVIVRCTMLPSIVSPD